MANIVLGRTLRADTGKRASDRTICNASTGAPTELKKAASYSRSDLVVKAGWGTTLGTLETNKLVARACAEKLIL